MILREATMPQLMERRDKLMRHLNDLQRQVGVIDAEMARRNQQWRQEQERDRKYWAENLPRRLICEPGSPYLR